MPHHLYNSSHQSTASQISSKRFGCIEEEFSDRQLLVERQLPICLRLSGSRPGRQIYWASWVNLEPVCRLQQVPLPIPVINWEIEAEIMVEPYHVFV